MLERTILENTESTKFLVQSLKSFQVFFQNVEIKRRKNSQVVTQTISRDLEDINAKVKTASYNLRAERVKLIKIKVKEVLGKDVDCAIGEFNTDAVVNLNLNDLAKTDGIVSINFQTTSNVASTCFLKIPVLIL